MLSDTDIEHQVGDCLLDSDGEYTDAPRDSIGNNISTLVIVQPKRSAWASWRTVKPSRTGMPSRVQSKRPKQQVSDIL